MAKYNNIIDFPTLLEAIRCHRRDTYKALGVKLGLSYGLVRNLALSTSVPSERNLEVLASYSSQLTAGNWSQWVDIREQEDLDREYKEVALVGLLPGDVKVSPSYIGGVSGEGEKPKGQSVSLYFLRWHLDAMDKMSEVTGESRSTILRRLIEDSWANNPVYWGGDTKEDKKVLAPASKTSDLKSEVAKLEQDPNAYLGLTQVYSPGDSDLTQAELDTLFSRTEE